jgi:hypothetical protein
MVIAALICFAILLVAWIAAPDRPRSVAPKPVVRQDPDLKPLLEAA